MSKREDVIKRPNLPSFSTQGRKNDICAGGQTEDGSIKFEMNYSVAIKNMPTQMLEYLFDQVSAELTVRRHGGLSR